MNIAITFRHLDTSEPIKTFAHDKVARLQKFLRQPMRAKVTLSVEDKQQHCDVEITAGGSRFVAGDSGTDMYAAIDRVIDKLERQINQERKVSIAKMRSSEGIGELAASLPEEDLSSDDSGS